MPDLFDDLRLALAALKLRFSVLIMAVSLLGTLLLIGCLIWAAGALFSASGFFGLFNSEESGWRSWLSGGFGSFMMLVIGWFLYPSLATAIACLFVEPLADRIERHSYPDLPAAKESSTLDQVKLFWQSLLRALSLNLLALPFYFIPGLNLIAYGLVNGRLLLHDYFFAVTLRHLPLDRANALYAAEKPRLFWTGLLLAGLFVLPFVNILAPIIATSLLIHRLMRKSESGFRQMLALDGSKMLLNPEVGAIHR